MEEERHLVFKEPIDLVLKFQEMSKNQDDYFLVYLQAPWCPDCIRAKP